LIFLITMSLIVVHLMNGYTWEQKMEKGNLCLALHYCQRKIQMLNVSFNQAFTLFAQLASIILD